MSDIQQDLANDINKTNVNQEKINNEEVNINEHKNENIDTNEDAKDSNDKDDHASTSVDDNTKKQSNAEKTEEIKDLCAANLTTPIANKVSTKEIKVDNYKDYGLDTPQKQVTSMEQIKKLYCESNASTQQQNEDNNRIFLDNEVVNSNNNSNTPTNYDLEDKVKRSLKKKISLNLQIDEFSAQKRINEQVQETILSSQSVPNNISIVTDLKNINVLDKSSIEAVPNNNTRVSLTNKDNLDNTVNISNKNESIDYNNDTFNENSIQNSTMGGLSYIIQQNNQKLSSKVHQKKKATNYKDLSKSNNNTVDYQRYMFKVILLGNIAVGKTCLLTYFVENMFRSEYSCTVGVDFKIKTVTLEPNKKVDLQIWDTSGEERFKTITRQYYRDASGIVLVFDVTNEKSFSDVIVWVEDIKLCAKENVSIVLVGNKTDLEEKRVVSHRVAQQFALKNNIQYYESSAKTGYYVSEMFEDLAQIMVNVFDIEEAKRRLENSNNSYFAKKDKTNFSTDDMRRSINSSRKKNCC